MKLLSISNSAVSIISHILYVVLVNFLLVGGIHGAANLEKAKKADFQPINDVHATFTTEDLAAFAFEDLIDDLATSGGIRHSLRDEEFAGSDVTKLDHLMSMDELVCYSCSDSDLIDKGDKMTCSLLGKNFDRGPLLHSLQEDEEYLIDDSRISYNTQKEFEKLLFFNYSNPCKLIVDKVLRLLEIEDKFIPIPLDPTGKGAREKYSELRSLVSTIQFQKRAYSELMTVEVQLRHKDEPFSFVLPDFDQQIPHTTIYYSAL